MGKNKKSGDSEKDKEGERIETRHKQQKKKAENKSDDEKGKNRRR